MNDITNTFPVVDEQGWNDATVIALIAAWLTQHPRYLASLENYFQRIAREENAERG